MRWSKFASVSALCLFSLAACKQEQSTTSRPSAEKARTIKTTKFNDRCHAELCSFLEGKMTLQKFLEKGPELPMESALKSHYDKNLKPLVEAKVSRDLEYKNTLLQLLKEKADTQSVSLSEKQHTVLNALKAIRAGGKALEKVEGFGKLDYVTAYNSSRADQTLMEYYKVLYPSMDGAEALRRDAEITLKRRQKLNEEFGVDFLSTESFLIRRAIEGDLIVGEDLRELTALSYETRVIEDMLKKPEMSKHVQISEPEIRHLISQVNDQKADAVALAYKYETDYFTMYSLLPSESEVTVLKDGAAKVKEQALLQIREGDAAYTRIQNANVYFPLSGAKFFEVVVKHFEAAINSNRLERLRQADSSQVAFLAAASSLVEKTDKKKNLFVTLTTDNEDRYIGKSSPLYISVLSIKSRHALSSLAYQYGYMAAEGVQGSQALKQCLNARNHSQVRENESFADHFASNIKKALSAEFQDERNWACYSSSSTGRVLNIALDSGSEVPSSCKKISSVKQNALNVCR